MLRFFRSVIDRRRIKSGKRLGLGGPAGLKVLQRRSFEEVCYVWDIGSADGAATSASGSV